MDVAYNYSDDEISAEEYEAYEAMNELFWCSYGLFFFLLILLYYITDLFIFIILF